MEGNTQRWTKNMFIYLATNGWRQNNIYVDEDGIGLSKCELGDRFMSLSEKWMKSKVKDRTLKSKTKVELISYMIFREL